MALHNIVQRLWVVLPSGESLCTNWANILLFLMPWPIESKQQLQLMELTLQLEQLMPPL